MENMSCKGLRRIGLIVQSEILSLGRVCGFQAQSFIGKSLYYVTFIVRYLLQKGC